MPDQELIATEYATLLTEGITPTEDFQPLVIHHNCSIEVILTNEPFKAKWIRTTLTVYIGRESGQVVGLVVSR